MPRSIYPALPTDTERPLLWVNEAAAALTISPRTLRRWIEGGRVPVVRIGGAVRLRREDVERIQREGLAAGAAEAPR